MLQPVQRQSLSDAVFDQLRDQIVSGEVEAGARLPSERELSEVLGVNRQAVREALKRLAQARLVSIHQGGATRVLAWRDAAGLGLLSTLIFRGDGTLDLGVARSAIEMRSALAPDIARLAAIRGGPTTADALDVLVEQMRGAGPDLAEVQTLALAYWGTLAAGSGNMAYRLAFNTLRESYQQFQRLLTQVLAVELADPEPYAALADAVRQRDAARAKELAATLIARGDRAMSAVLGELEAPVTP